MDFVVQVAPIDVVARSLRFIDQRARSQSLARLREFTLQNKPYFNISVSLEPDTNYWNGENIEILHWTQYDRINTVSAVYTLREHVVTTTPRYIRSGINGFVYRPDKYGKTFMAIKKTLKVHVEYGADRSFYLRHVIDKDLMRQGVVSTVAQGALLFCLVPDSAYTGPIDQLGYVRVQVYCDSHYAGGTPCFAYRIEEVFLSETVVFGLLATQEPTAVVDRTAWDDDSDDSEDSKDDVLQDVIAGLAENFEELGWDDSDDDIDDDIDDAYGDEFDAGSSDSYNGGYFSGHDEWDDKDDHDDYEPGFNQDDDDESDGSETDVV